MASDHVIALSHLVGLGFSLALAASAGRSLAHRRPTRVRTEDALPRGRCLRALARLTVRFLHGTAWLTLNVVFAAVTPIGVLCANGRYPLVTPVLAPFEARLAALGHRTAHACCFPLLAWHVWLVRCAGCHRRSFFREVPAPRGSGVELKALGKDVWRTRRCPAEYLTAQPESAAGRTQPVRLAPRLRPVQSAPTAQPASVVSPSLPHPPATDKTA